MEINLKRVGKTSASRFALGVVFLFLAIQLIGKVQHPAGNDFVSYLASSRALMAGADPYATGNPFPYVYPAFLAFALIPLALLPLSLASLVWLAFNAWTYFYSLQVLSRYVPREVGERIKAHSGFVILVFTALMFHILQNHFLNGQVNLILLALLLSFFHHDSKNHDVSASVFLSLAIAIKLLPVLLAAYLLFRRKSKSIAYTVLLSAFWMILPAVASGRKQLAFTLEYFQGFVMGRIGSIGSFPANPADYSLQSLLRRIFPRGQDFALVFVAAALVVVLICYAELFLNKKMKRGSDLPLFSLYLVAMLLISPMSETHHLVFFIPALFIGGVMAWSRAESGAFAPAPSWLSVFGLLMLGKLFREGLFSLLALALGLGLLLRSTQTRAGVPVSGGHPEGQSF